jgi:hypothetical protein
MVSPSNHWSDWNKLSWIAVRDVPIFTFEFLLFTFFPARGIASVLEGSFRGQKSEPNPLRQRLNDLNEAKRLNDWNGFR